MCTVFVEHSECESEARCFCWEAVGQICATSVRHKWCPNKSTRLLVSHRAGTPVSWVKVLYLFDISTHFPSCPPWVVSLSLLLFYVTFSSSLALSIAHYYSTSLALNWVALHTLLSVLPLPFGETRLDLWYWVKQWASELVGKNPHPGYCCYFVILEDRKLSSQQASGSRRESMLLSIATPSGYNPQSVCRATTAKYRELRFKILPNM